MIDTILIKLTPIEKSGSKGTVMTPLGNLEIKIEV